MKDESKQYILQCLENLQGRGKPYYPLLGICANVEVPCHTLEGIWRDWPEHSGIMWCPVPTGDPSLNVIEAYKKRDGMWDREHPYGAARWRLLEWTIAKLERELGETEEGA